MITRTLDEVRRDIQMNLAGARVAFNDQEGRVRIGTIRIKKVRCGKKNCRKCPHAIYAYAQYRDGERVKEKYIGVVRGSR